MGSLNDAHHENGGVILYAGELILMYCDSVHAEVKNHGHAKGRMYLTTHRIVFTANPINLGRNLTSMSIPFFSMHDLSLEQPIFGANYIKGKVRGYPDYAFELKFNKGGAIEFGQAMLNAAKQAASVARQTNFTPDPTFFYSAPSAAEYYQAPEGVFQPSYPIGFVLPTQVFPEAPQPGFIYATQTPPPYPGLVPNQSNDQPPPYNQATANPYQPAANPYQPAANPYQPAANLYQPAPNLYQPPTNPYYQQTPNACNPSMNYNQSASNTFNQQIYPNGIPNQYCPSSSSANNIGFNIPPDASKKSN